MLRPEERCFPILKIGARTCAPAFPKSNILISSGRILFVHSAGGKWSNLVVRLVKNRDFSLSSLICKGEKKVVRDKKKVVLPVVEIFYKMF